MGGIFEQAVDWGGLLQEESILIETGADQGVRSLVEGRIHPVLQQEARQHAQYQARIGVQGHQGWDQRYQRLSSQFPNLRAAEICAESWSWETDHLSAAKSMYASWRQSSGHWETANGPATYIGYSMARGRSRRTGEMTYYACAIVVR